jgi:hypothetical protein
VLLDERRGDRPIEKPHGVACQRRCASEGSLAASASRMRR